MNDTETFDNINKAMDTTFTPTSSTEISAIETELQEFEDSKKQLTTLKSKEITLQDKKYLNEQIKDTIANGKTVLEKLQSEIKIGSSARMYDVYAKLMESVISGIRELRDLSKMVFDTELFANVDPEEDKKANININVNGKELLQAIKDAQAKNELNTIEADFTIEDEEKESEI